MGEMTSKTGRTYADYLRTLAVAQLRDILAREGYADLPRSTRKPQLVDYVDNLMSFRHDEAAGMMSRALELRAWRGDDEPGYEPTPTAERVTRADGVVFVVGDVVTWAKGPDAETQWRIDTLYVPHTGDLEPYAGMSAVEQPKYGTRGTAGQLSLLRHAGRPGVVGVGMAGWHELEDPAVTVERIVRRAQYNALRKMLEVLDGWTRGARENHDALGHRGESVPCWSQFARADIIVMVADAACELGTFDPTRAVGDV